MNNKKDHIFACLIAIAVHALIALILFFLNLTVAAADKDKQDEGGVPVMLGMVDDASGMDLGGMPSAEAESGGEEQSESEAADVPAEQPAAAPEPSAITQMDEKSIAAEEAKRKAAEEAKIKAAEEAKRKAAEEAKKKAAAEEAARRKAAEEAAKKRAAEEAARQKAAADKAAAAAANSRVAGAFGNGKNNGSSGYSQGDGSQGSPDGNSNTGSTTGTGGYGTSANVANRTVVYLGRPSYSDTSNEGTVVVAISVDEAGNVVNASIKSSTTASSALRNAAIVAAKKSKFSKGEGTESGTITYRFKLR